MNNFGSLAESKGLETGPTSKIANSSIRVLIEQSARSRCPLSLAVSAALFFGIHAPAQAGLFPSEIELGGLEGSNGFVIDGEAANNSFGFSVSGAGDINGDGVADVIIGARGAGPPGGFVGRTYVVFGSTEGFASPFDLSTLDGSNGFALNGEELADQSGRSVSAAADINGDGIDDLVIGAPFADPNGSLSGRSYVVFGSASGFSSAIDLGDLDGLDGFVINGEAEGDQSGHSVAGAGDINADGIDDLIIGAHRAGPNGLLSGRSYVVFGSTTAFSTPFELSSLDGANGFALNGESANDRAGFSVSTAGDVNGDGIDDVIIGAFLAQGAAFDSGRSYVVFGSDVAFASVIELSSLDGSNGFILDGASEEENSGRSVALAGDFNGDGIDDLIIGASQPYAEPPTAGRSYVVFGSDGGFASTVNLSALDGNTGIVINGVSAADLTGESVSAAGDINGDGFDDVVLGAPDADPNGSDSGRAYVVFGSNHAFPNPFDLSTINGSNGFVLNGEVGDGGAGFSVAAAGDINGDGADDLILGAPFLAEINLNRGRSYVIYGRAAIFNDRFEAN